MIHNTQELVAFKNGLTMTGGDWGSLSQLFFDNLSTLLGALFAIQSMAAFGVPTSLLNEYIFGRIVPGVGVTLALGNIYYSWQAVRLTNKHGRQYTAQPYGLNTPAAFAFVFNIIYAVYFANVGALGPEDAFILGYKVALAANFITGLISVVLGMVGPIILKVVPPAALLVPIAGIGVAFLGLEQLSNSIAAPIVGYSAIMWVYLGWYASVRLGYGKFRMPEALQVIVVGVILGWASGLNEKATVNEASKLVKWWGPVWSAGDLFRDFSEVKDYLGIVIPIVGPLSGVRLYDMAFGDALTLPSILLFDRVFRPLLPLSCVWFLPRRRAIRKSVVRTVLLSLLELMHAFSVTNFSRLTL